MLRALVEVVLPVFGVVAVGWLLARLRRFDIAAVGELLVSASLPALILDSLTRHRPSFAALGKVSVACLAVVVIVGSAAYVTARLAGWRRRGVVLTSAFMNAGNFGLPLAYLAFGEAATPYAAAYYVTMAVIHNSIGIWIASGRASGWREMLRMPLVHAAAVGLVLSALDVTLPTVVAKPITLLAQTAVPLMLLSLGYTLRQIRLTALRPALAATTLRIAGGFGTALAFVTLSGATGVLGNVVLLSSSMPAAVLNVVLAQRFDADADVVGTTVLLSTLVSVVTVPLVLQLAASMP